jgi:hypothetical protein
MVPMFYKRAGCNFVSLRGKTPNLLEGTMSPPSLRWSVLFGGMSMMYRPRALERNHTEDKEVVDYPCDMLQNLGSKYQVGM